MTLGSLTKVNLRQQWANEESDFTPWLAQPENIETLSNAIGIELEVEGVEVPVGPYRADILARDTGSENYVVIENQLEKTDHSHLGKSLTYSSVLGASTVIWIAKKFTDEHKKTLDWLNDHTTDEVGFFGIVLELWQIDDSRPAVRFNVVSSPANIVRQATSAKSKQNLSPTKKLQLEFWEGLRLRLLERSDVIPSVRTAHARYWYDISLGKTGIHLSTIANTENDEIGVRLYIQNRWGDTAFAHLMADKQQIEREIGIPLDWNPNPDKRDKIIRLRRNANIRDKSQWDDYLDWLENYVIKFRKTFAHRVRQLSLDEIETEMSENSDSLGSE